MKVLIIGDGYINDKDMVDGFKSWADRGCELVGYQWDQNGMDMSEINLLLEQNGPEAVESPTRSLIWPRTPMSSSPSSAPSTKR